MSEELCCCDTIGHAADTVRLCPSHHRYFWGDRELLAVSKILYELIPGTYDGVDPDVVENAKIRGIAVDKHFSEALRTGTVTIAPGEREDVKERLGRLIQWWNHNEFELIDVQKTVFSIEDGVAGTMDLKAKRQDQIWILDLKVVYGLTPRYGLQLGGYAAYDDVVDAVGIIHVDKRSVRLVPYSIEKCRQQWRAAVTWFKTLRSL